MPSLLRGPRALVLAVVLALVVGGSAIAFSGGATGVKTERPANCPPHARDDAARAESADAITVDVLENDSDPDGDALLFNVVESSAGSVKVDQNGTPTDSSDDRLSYTPLGTTAGVETVTYEIEDPEGLTDQATVTIVVGTDTAAGEAAGDAAASDSASASDEAGEVDGPVGAPPGRKSVYARCGSDDKPEASSTTTTSTSVVAEETTEALEDTAVEDDDSAGFSFSGIRRRSTATTTARKKSPSSSGGTTGGGSGSGGTTDTTAGGGSGGTTTTTGRPATTSTTRPTSTTPPPCRTAQECRDQACASDPRVCQNDDDPPPTTSTTTADDEE